MVDTRRAGFLLHDLSCRADQPNDAVLLPGQRVAALLHLDQQGIRQFPLDVGIFDLNIGQRIGNIPNHLILVQQKQIVAVRYAAGLPDLRLGIPFLPR